MPRMEYTKTKYKNGNYLCLLSPQMVEILEAKMKPAITIGLLLIIILVGNYTYTAQTTKIADLDAEIAFLQRPLTVEAQIKAIQQQVGAEVDGVIGYETMGLANAKVKEERREEHNQYALKWFDANSYAKGVNK